MQRRIRAEKSRAAARTFDNRLQMRLAFNVFFKIAEVLGVIFHRLQIVAILDDDKAGRVRNVTPFLKIDGERIGVMQLVKAHNIVLQTGKRRFVNLKRVALKIVIAEKNIGQPIAEST